MSLKIPSSETSMLWDASQVFRIDEVLPTYKWGMRADVRGFQKIWFFVHILHSRLNYLTIEQPTVILWWQINNIWGPVIDGNHIMADPILLMKDSNAGTIPGGRVMSMMEHDGATFVQGELPKFAVKAPKFVTVSLKICFLRTLGKYVWRRLTDRWLHQKHFYPRCSHKCVELRASKCDGRAGFPVDGI